MLDRYRPHLLILCLSLASCSSPPPPAGVGVPAGTTRTAESESLTRQVDAILADSVLAPCLIGAKIVALDDGKVLYQRNSNKLFHPASNMKLITSAAALNLLGTDFRFRTRLLADSSIRHGVLPGSLYVKGFGDPMFTNSDMDSLASSVRNCGVGAISGDIVGDVSYFDSLSWGSGWMWDDEPDPDEAFISALTVNNNAFDVSVRPGHRVAEPAEVAFDPPTSYIRTLNSAITSFDTAAPALSVTRRRGENTVIIEGRISPHSPERHFRLSVWKPEMYFLSLFKERLAAKGISVRGSLRLDTASGGAQLVELSHPIDSVFFEVNKPSDNIAAENLLKTIAAEKTGKRGSASLGLSFVRSYLATIGVDTTMMVLADGSGVSWYNAISPDAIVQLLLSMYRDRERFPLFYGSLPIAGVDGTLKSRMKGTLAAGNVHAKTGSLTGVSSLSGYVTAADGKLLAFSLLCNHFPSQLSTLRDSQDRIMEILARWRANAQ